MASSTTTVRSGYRFGPFSLDLRSGDLSRNGRPIRLQEKPRSLLLALAQRRGELVSRKELHEHLWPNDTFVDFEDGLNAAMSKLREALDDDSQSPRFIETVRGRGYRFIAKVEMIEAVEESVPVFEPAAKSAPGLEMAPPAAFSVQEWRRGKKLLAATIGLVLAGAVTPLQIGLGFVAVVFGSANVFGGFMVTDRMLQMFKKKK